MQALRRALAAVLTPTVREPWSVATAAVMAAFAELAYSSSIGLGTLQPRPGHGYLTIFERGGVFAYLLRRDDAAILAFRGTADFADWQIDLNAVPRAMPGRPGIRVHCGFWDAWASVAPEISAAIAALPPALPVYITGHSLGGALAQVGAAALDHNPNLAACYTFGSPRVADQGFDALVACPHYRVVDNWDLVPSVPPALPGRRAYRHSGDPRLLAGAHPAYAQRRDRDLIPRILADAWSLALWPLTGRLTAVSDHMIWTYRAKLEAIAAKQGRMS